MGGGGTGSRRPSPASNGTTGTINTGSGGGWGSNLLLGPSIGSGGSGIVVIRYPA